MAEEEEERLDIELGEKEEQVYDDEARESLLEDDEIEPWEEGFMEGAEMDGQDAKCKKCGGVVTKENAVEKRIAGEVCYFCSNKCLEEYEKEHKEE